MGRAKRRSKLSNHFIQHSIDGFIGDVDGVRAGELPVLDVFRHHKDVLPMTERFKNRDQLDVMLLRIDIEFFNLCGGECSPSFPDERMILE